MSFITLGLCQALSQTLEKLNYKRPTPIQKKAIPAVLSKQDLIAIAQTGTGKTASFVLPILQLLADGPIPPQKKLRALVIAPTRELAAQLDKSVNQYSQALAITSSVVFGGVRIEAQLYALEQGIDLLVATPGRLIDLYKQGAINFEHLEILVLDEADRMLDLGFIDDISYIQSLLPKDRQSLLFSATFTKDIKALAKSMLHKPLTIEVENTKQNLDAITQIIHPVDQARKSELLIHLLKHNNWSQLLVFTRTKRGADELVATLENLAFSADSIHANRTQRARTLALEGFKNGSLKVLVATDIAARGIDIEGLPCVINFDLPFVPEDYVHRIGRTGRAGAKGSAISFCSLQEHKQLQAIEQCIKRKLEMTIVSGFTPTEKAITAPAKDDDQYGNFEADSIPKGTKKARKKRSKTKWGNKNWR